MAEVRTDPKFPDIKTWAELRNYLLARGAAHEAFVAGRTVWREYRRRLKP